MVNHRLMLTAGFGIVSLTTLWFGYSATRLSEARIVEVGSLHTCPPAITVAASTCRVTYTATATLVYTSTIVVEGDQSPIPAPQANAQKPGPLFDDDDDDLPPSKPSTPPASLVTEAPMPKLSPQDDEDFDLNEVLTKFECFPAAEIEAQKMVSDTDPSIKFNVVRGDNVVLGRKPKQTGTPLKTFYSVGRKPSAGCWTYRDRLGKYLDTIPRFVRSLGVLNQCNPKWKRAVVVQLAKGQSWNKHFTRHLSALVNEVGWMGNYHVHILAFVDGDKKEQQNYVKDVIPEIFRPLVTAFNTSDLKTHLGEEVPFDTHESMSHVAIQKFMHDNPNYEFVYFINSATRLIGRWDTLLKTVDHEYAFHKDLAKSTGQAMPKVPDLVTFDVTREPDEKWEALEWACLQFFKGEGKEKKVRRSLSAMGGFSRRMVEALAAVNKQKINCNSEYFAPTVAAHSNLTTFFYQHPLYGMEEMRWNDVSAKVGPNDAITVQKDKVAFDLSWSSNDKEAQIFWEEWVNNPEVCRPEALLHPVTGQF
ncbi:hypothetical protein AA313_de0203468 [Arthrobotrys entomopaga]|nr:hypothetical protein AA313_de0203468 [Arthrobotrys entomopaga]